MCRCFCFVLGLVAEYMDRLRDCPAALTCASSSACRYLICISVGMSMEQRSDMITCSRTGSATATRTPSMDSYDHSHGTHGQLQPHTWHTWSATHRYTHGTHGQLQPHTCSHRQAGRLDGRQWRRPWIYTDRVLYLLLPAEWGPADFKERHAEAAREARRPACCRVPSARCTYHHFEPSLCPRPHHVELNNSAPTVHC